jgi:hypothetical protein
VSESRDVSARFFSCVFVAAKYFGYLRREPEEPFHLQRLTLSDANRLNFRNDRQRVHQLRGLPAEMRIDVLYIVESQRGAGNHPCSSYLVSRVTT